jgi:hypothetical protein
MKGLRWSWLAGVWLLASPILAADGPDDLFRCSLIPGVGRSQKFSAADFSYFCNIRDLAVADLNQDGHQDLLLLSGSEHIYIDDDAYSTARPTANSKGWLEPGDYLYGADGAGVDGDAFTEYSANIKAGLVGDPWGRNYQGSDLAWLANNGFGGFQLRLITVAGGVGPHFDAGNHLEAANLTSPDTFPDIVVWPGGSGNPTPPQEKKLMWYKNLGGGAFQEHVLHSNFALYDYGGIGDFNHDGHLDVLDRDHLFLGSNAGPTNVGVHITPNFPGIPGVFPVESAVVTDFDGDSWADALFGTVNQIAFYRNDHDPGGALFTRRDIVAGPSTIQSVSAMAVADINGDGLNDIVAGDAAGANSSVRLFLTNDATYTSWTETALPDANNLLKSIYSVEVADLNHDSRPDIVSVAMANKFSAGQQADGKDCLAMAWVARHQDADADGTIDPGELQWDTVPLVEPQTWPTPTPAVASPCPVYPGSQGQPALAVADFDGDGDNDVFRSTRHTPLAFFQNVWNRRRFARVRATVRQGKDRHQITEFIGGNARPGADLDNVLGRAADAP